MVAAAVLVVALLIFSGYLMRLALKYESFMVGLIAWLAFCVALAGASKLLF